VEPQVPQHVKISTNRRGRTVRLELDYGREAFISVVWNAEEAMAVARALAEAADELLHTGASTGSSGRTVARHAGGESEARSADESGSRR
jgi:hypothetical protein